MSKVKQEIEIRKVTEQDFNSLIQLICALADYEKLERPDKEAQNRLKNDIFGPDLKIKVYLGEIDNKAIAYAITCYLYSSFLARPTLYIEDIFVLPEYRKVGVGKEFLKFLAKVALEEGCGRMEWMVLDWNKLAINFYEKIGAKKLNEWVPYRLTKTQLEKIVNG